MTRSRRQRPFFLFEFFPPRDDAGSRQLFATIEALAPLRPAFVSITYGAGGSTRARTVALAKEIQQRIGLTVVAHVTCVGAEPRRAASAFRRAGAGRIENVLALRGDPPPGTRFVPSRAVSRMPTSSSPCSAELRFLHRRRVLSGETSRSGDFRRRSCGAQEKVDAGADFLVSQLFFDNARYFEFERRARVAGITLPILPGLMPITNFGQIERFVAMCGASIPPKLRVEMEARKGRRKSGRGSRASPTHPCRRWNCCMPAFPAFIFTRSTVRPQRVPSFRRCLAASAWRPPPATART